MKVLRGILILLVILLIAFFVVAIFLPGEYEVARSTEIDRPVDVVYAQLIQFQDRAEWDPWLAGDSTAVATVSGQETGVGAQYSWTGAMIGVGKMTIEEVIPNEFIKSKLIFTAPQEMSSDVIWKLEPTDTGTKATWINRGELVYPVQRYMGLMMDKMMGSSFEHGLASLKILMEARPVIEAEPMLVE
ncbi:SRPBCC family protein [bacterium]|nr:SRPBCC family protein [bacterium]